MGEKKEKVVSLLSVLVKQHKEAGGKIPTKKDGQALIKAYEVSRRNSQEAANTLVAAKIVESEAAKAMVLAFGKRKVPLSDGSEVRPMSRGDRVYYRGTGEEEEVVQY